MATATKSKAPVKKAAPSPEPEPEKSKRAERAERNGALQEEVVKLRDEEEAKWGEIAEQLEITPGKAMFLYMQAEVAGNPKSKITFKDDEDLAAKVVAARTEEMLSWGQIAARAGVSEGKLKRLFATAAEEIAVGHRIGKGGRFPKGVEPPPKPEKATKATSTTTKKAAGGTAKPLLKITDVEEMGARLNGKTIKITRNGKETRLGVKTVKELANGTLSFISDRGQTRSVKVEEISVTRPAT
jgi:AraC-like DNA-binding protein